LPKLIFIFLLFGSMLLSAQDSTEVRHFNSAELEEFAKDEKHQYNRDVQVREPNAFLKGLGKVLGYIGKFIMSKKGVFFFVILLVAGILYAFRNSIFKKKAKKESIGEYLPNVAIKKDSDTVEKIKLALEKAEKEGDYRSAIRNLYVLVILSLSDAKLIQYHIEKTNSDYRKELPKKLQANFKSLTRIFDFIWYGDYPASEELLAQAKNYAQSLNQRKNVA